MWLNHVSVKTGLPQVLQSNIRTIGTYVSVQCPGAWMCGMTRMDYACVDNRKGTIHDLAKDILDLRELER